MPLSRLTPLPIMLFSFCLAGCASLPKKEQDGPPRRHVDVRTIPNAKPRHLPRSRYGNPPSYVANGKRYYVLKTSKGYNERGIASWYGRKFHGRLTSTREPYNMFAMTAASPVLPIPCFVRVTNLENGRQVVVKVNDRGPFAPNRIIDLSYAAAKKLGYEKNGTALVQVTTITPNQTGIPAVDRIHHPRLYLQIGAFSDYSNAQRLRSNIAHFTHKPVIIRASDGNRVTLYRVQIGPLTGVGESDQLVNQLHQAGIGDALTVIG